MTNKIFILSVFTIICFMTSCQKEGNKLIAERTFYDFPKDKLWAHRVNTALEANDLHKEFNGTETDVFFINNKEFQTGHDSPSGRTLESFFDSIQNCSHYYYWIDFKNLSNDNAETSLSEMKRLIDKFHLEKRIIVESSEPAALQIYKCDDIYTSLWIEQLNVFFPYFAENKIAKEINEKIEKYQFDAISCCYEMNGFCQKHFINYNIHVWTNGISGYEGCYTIDELASYDNVKVILVDYKTNFLN